MNPEEAVICQPEILRPMKCVTFEQSSANVREEGEGAICCSFSSLPLHHDILPQFALAVATEAERLQQVALGAEFILALISEALVKKSLELVF